MDLDRSELSGSDFLSGASISESHDSSHSSNFVATWPDTHAQTYRFLQEAQLETKKAQLERHGTELEATVLEREVGLQADIRAVNSSVNDLRLEIADQEATLSQIKETRNADILEIRKRLAARLAKYEGVLLETDKTIGQMQEALRAKRDAHEKRKAALLQECQDAAAEQDAAIAELAREVESVRKQTNDAVQKGEADALDTQAAIEHLQIQIRALAADSASIDGQFAQLNHELTGLKRELIFAEEEGESVRQQIEASARLRAQIRAVIDRTRQQQWAVQTRNLYVLE
jgi:chromosome segregation ATPase